MPFPSAQCEGHIWIRLAGNVSISFLLWRGERGHGVHCEGVYMARGRGGGGNASLVP